MLVGVKELLIGSLELDIDVRLDTFWSDMLKNDEKRIEEAMESKVDDVFPVEQLFGMKSKNLETTSTWIAFVLAGAVSRTHTDVDGKYNVEVRGGHYYAYARYESAYSVVEWMIPVNVIDPKNISIDFHNETAESIENKND